MSRHGMVRAVGTHFEYEDGMYFYPFGTTVYALAHQEERLIDETLRTLKNSPFNKVRMCVFPKHYQYNNNEPQFYPFERNGDGSWNVGRPCDDFWNHLEDIIKGLDDLEIECDLILFHPYDNWGFSQLSQRDNIRYLDYCTRRLGHLKNIWWSLANEYDLCLGSKSMEDWKEIEEFVASHNPNHHLLSNHNCFIPWDVSRPNITHGSYQTKRFADVPNIVNKFEKPIMVDECCYEGNLPEFWGCLSGEEMTARFWRVVSSGAYCTHGETFMDNEHEIVWWAKGGTLKGKSPARIQFLKNIVYELPSPIEPTVTAAGTFDNLPEEVRRDMESQPMFLGFQKAMAMMTKEDKHIHYALEYCYAGHCGEEVYLNYYDQRCSVKDTIVLPKDKSYRIELIDTWNMKREIIVEGACGETEIYLPGRPYMAVLATTKQREFFHA